MMLLMRDVDDSDDDQAQSAEAFCKHPDNPPAHLQKDDAANDSDDESIVVEPQDPTVATVEQATPTNQSMTDAAASGEAETSTGQRKRVAGRCTARQRSNKKTKTLQRKKGARIKVRRDNLFHLLLHQSQRDALAGFSNDYNVYGKILSGSGKQGYNISFDIFPSSHKEVVLRHTKVITPVEVVAGEELPEYDHENDPTRLENPDPPSKKLGDQAQSAEAFCKLGDTSMKDAMEYMMKYGPGEEEAYV